MGPIVCPETSAKNYHYSLRKRPEERISLDSQRPGSYLNEGPSQYKAKVTIAHSTKTLGERRSCRNSDKVESVDTLISKGNLMMIIIIILNVDDKCF
jgi:hypothetical protein